MRFRRSSATSGSCCTPATRRRTGAPAEHRVRHDRHRRDPRVYGDRATRPPAALPYLLAFAAGGFLYVAMADLIPGLHSHQQARHPVRQTLLIAAGIGTMLARCRAIQGSRGQARASTPSGHPGDDIQRRWIEIQATGARHLVARALIKEGAERSRRETPIDGPPNSGHMSRSKVSPCGTRN